MIRLQFTLFVLILSLGSAAQEIKSPFQVIPELYPAKTVRVAFHVIHRYDLEDTFNLPNDELANQWWSNRVDSMNKYLSHPAKPNYDHYKDYARDSKVRLSNHGIFHHVDSNYWINASIPSFYHRFVGENDDFSLLMKDSVLHSFYYGDDRWGGMAGGIPTRWGMRFKGRYKEFYHYRLYPPMGHARNDHNYIHELGHAMGLYHNYQNSNNGQGTQCTGCDHQLGGYCFDMQAKPYAANNYMAKGMNVGPWGHSFTYCQQQKIIYYLFGLDKNILGTKRDISMCTEPISNCEAKFTANLKDSTVLDYDFKAFGDIVIPAGGVFVLKSNLEMPAEAKIIVEPGAKLILDGGKITSSPECGVPWGGTELKKRRFLWWLGNKERRAKERPGSLELLNEGQLLF